MKAATLLILALLAGLASMFFVRQHLVAKKGTQRQVFRAGAPAKAGETLAGRVETVTFPEKMFPRLLTEAPGSDMADYVTKTPLARPVTAGEIILFRHFDTSLDPGIRDQIPAGMKAMTIKVSEDSAVGYFVEPGDLVDVIGSLTDKDTGAVSNRPMLQAVRILAVGGRYSNSPDLPRAKRDYSTVTVLVTMEEAQKLALARDFLGGKLTLLLRSPADGESRTGVLKEINPVQADFDTVGNQPAPAAGR